MGKRLMHVLYTALHIPIFIILFIGYYDVYEEGPYNYSNYNVICNATGQPVVLQGSLDNEPWLVGHYQYFDSFDFQSLNLLKKDIRFYCQYQNEIAGHIVAYQSAYGDVQNQMEANRNYFEYAESKENNITPVINYELVLVNEEILWTDYYLEYVWITIGAILYFIFLQFIRIIYQYIVFGKIPFNVKNLKN